jgi:protein TorT
MHRKTAALLAGIGGIGLCAFSFGAQAQEAAWKYKVDVWSVPFDMHSKTSTMEYVPLAKADKNYNICASFPHMKDSYWLAADYGMIEEARRQGVSLQIVEAGGYTELNKQISQVEDCVSAGAKALIIGAISYDGMNNLLAEVKKKGVVIVDAINGVSSKDIDAKSIVSWEQVGKTLGEYLAAKHPKGSAPVKLGWFPGPAGAGFVEDSTRGFKAGVEGSAITVAEVKYGDTGKEVQSKLVEDMIEAHPDLKYIAGAAVAAEAAIPILRARGVDKQIGILSYYFTPGMRQGIERGQILAAASDSTVMQGRIAVDQTIRILEGKEYQKHIGPSLIVVTKDNIGKLDMGALLAPDNFSPVFKSN